jgi:beta-lactamase regulating signal transducer with metallopeptidase domain
MMCDRWSLAAFTTGVVTFCATSLVTGHHVGIAAAATAWLFGVALMASVARATQHARLVRLLRRRSVPDRLSGIAVRTGDLGDPAFVAGLSRPTIFCDARLPEQLTSAQLRAVLLHERAHQRSFDPARLLMIAVVAPVARLLPAGRQWLATTLARREIAADDQAIACGAARSDLAAALLKLPPLAHARVAGFTPAAELRLRALLGEGSGPTTPPALRRIGYLLAGGLVGATLCAWFLHRILAAGVGLACC